jgi:Domain of unknown function (DUF4384)
MILRKTVLPSVAALALLPLTTAAQQHTARDAFWSSSDLITVTPNPGSHKQSTPRPRAPKTSDSGSTTGLNHNADSAPSNSVKAVQLVSENGYGAAPHLIRATEDRLGLRCSVLLRQTDAQYLEIAPGSVFHSGDHIRLGLLANGPGYLYVISQGSSGAWSPIFPPPGASVSKIAAGQLQMVPSGNRAFAFDQHPGDEKLFVILSRAPIEDIDHVVRDLKGDNGPDATQPAPPGGAVVEAENKIPDMFVQQLASRDLTLVDEQKVDESSTDSQAGEKAIYVVSKGNGPTAASQVMLSLNLAHQ